MGSRGILDDLKEFGKILTDLSKNQAKGTFLLATLPPSPRALYEGQQKIEFDDQKETTEKHIN